MKFFRILAGLLMILALVGIIGVLGLLLISNGNPVDFVQTQIVRLRISGREADLVSTVNQDQTPRRFTVSSGDTPRQIGINLLNDGLINDADLFVDYVRIADYDTELEAGTYFLRSSQTIPEIAKILTDSRGSSIPFRVIEGWRIEQVAESIDSNPLFGFSGAEFLTVVNAGGRPDPLFAQQVGLPAGASHEGFLFPNGYSLPPDITPEGLRQALTDEYIAQVTNNGITTAALTRGVSLYQLTILASIVQREAVQMEESPLIAGVYQNRLDIGMKLDADPTVQYPLGQPGDWWARITQADYSGVQSRYNTYLYTGLPPGPIASPGLAALSGAATPESSPYFYFQADCSVNGYHKFAETYAEHLANSCF